ncbi:MAG: Rrf2 family transcriptional regulator [Sphaerochaetaceae bacterium]|jgi:Rrf2 family protein|nr:Rrf2 family transcriptional regulator [Sphaerochaetaceae bacterium]
MTAEFPVAVHALVYLAVHPGREYNSNELADNICTNPARVRKVMAKLCHHRLAVSFKGQGSGYRCIDSARETVLSQVLEALDEHAFSACWKTGDKERDCLVCSGMSTVMESVYTKLNQNAISLLEGITIGSLCDKITSRA